MRRVQELEFALSKATEARDMALELASADSSELRKQATHNAQLTSTLQVQCT